jgi:hypothetical protein
MVNAAKAVNNAQRALKLRLNSSPYPSLDRVPESHLAVLTSFGLGPPERLHGRANFEQHAASINPNRQVTDDDGHYWY